MYPIVNARVPVDYKERDGLMREKIEKESEREGDSK